MGTAKQHTGEALQRIEQAAPGLAYFEGRCLNGFGELADPSYARGVIVDAIAHLLHARDAIDAAARAGWTMHDDEED